MENRTSSTALGPAHAGQREKCQENAPGETDDATFERIVAIHQQRVTRLVHRLLERPDDVEDVVQEVFLAVLTKSNHFRGQSKLSTWLTRIAINKCRSYRRRRLLEIRTWFRLAEAAGVQHQHQRQPDDEPETIHHELNRAVHRLKAKYREPIVLRYFEDLSAAEIAEVLGISTGAVDARLTRARRQLKEMLSAHAREQ